MYIIFMYYTLHSSYYSWYLHICLRPTYNKHNFHNSKAAAGWYTALNFAVFHTDGNLILNESPEETYQLYNYLLMYRISPKKIWIPVWWHEFPTQQVLFFFLQYLEFLTWPLCWATKGSNKQLINYIALIIT